MLGDGGDVKDVEDGAVKHVGEEEDAGEGNVDPSLENSIYMAGRWGEIATVVKMSSKWTEYFIKTITHTQHNFLHQISLRVRPKWAIDGQNYQMQIIYISWSCHTVYLTLLDKR